MRTERAGQLITTNNRLLFPRVENLSVTKIEQRHLNAEKEQNRIKSIWNNATNKSTKSSKRMASNL